MGIKNLHRFLKKHTELIYNEVKLSDYSNKTIAIDINVYLYRYKSIHKDKWLNVFLTLVLLLCKYNIQCIFIYDTKAPIEKNAKKEERKRRKKNAEIRIRDIKNDIKEYDDTGVITPLLSEISTKRGGHLKNLLRRDVQNPILDRESIYEELNCLTNQIVNISRAEIAMSKKVLELLGIPFYDSVTEAETLCAYLCCHGKVDAVLSDDTDVLVYGTPVFATKLNLKNETFIELRYSDIISNLNLQQNQFTDLCIMCGTDYNDNVPQIGSEKAFKLIQKYTNLEGISVNREDLDLSILNFTRVREIFSVPDVLDEYILNNKTPQIDEFMEFVATHNIQINSTREQIIKDMSLKCSSTCS
jgi:5'-3' exonuclease